MRRHPLRLATALAVLAGGLSLAAAGISPTKAAGDCPAVASSAPASTDGSLSPYLAHTGANDGAGSEFAGSFAGKEAQMDMEVEMGVHATFLPVHWSSIEPTQPTAAPPAPIAAGVEPVDPWHKLDRFVRAAQQRHLHVHVLVTVGGNAGGPPGWAGRRSEGRSAPLFMDGTEPGANGQGLVPFTAKLVDRYKPGGHLATADGWTDGYGVDLWILDNEPDSYQTNWDTVADDYAEFVVKASQAIKARQPNAKVLAPESAEGNVDMPFLTAALQTGVQQASQLYRDRFAATGEDYVIGPHVDVVTFHSYETFGLIFANALLDGDELSVQQLLRNRRKIETKFAEFEDQPGHEYAPKTEFWHTEGGFGFIADDPQNKERWVIQWLTIGFANGIDRLSIMDATTEEQRSVHTMTCLLPDPFPMTDVAAAVGAPSDASVFRSARNTDGGWTYVAWAKPVSGGSVFSQSVTVPVRGDDVRLVSMAGTVTPATVVTNPVTGAKTVTVDLAIAGIPFNEPVFVVDQAAA